MYTYQMKPLSLRQVYEEYTKAIFELNIHIFSISKQEIWVYIYMHNLQSVYRGHFHCISTASWLEMYNATSLWNVKTVKVHSNSLQANT